jgi:hypothetical protein
MSNRVIEVVGWDDVQPGMSVETSPGRFEYVYDAMRVFDGDEPLLACKLEMNNIFVIDHRQTMRVRVLNIQHGDWPHARQR